MMIIANVAIIAGVVGVVIRCRSVAIDDQLVEGYATIYKFGIRHGHSIAVYFIIIIIAMYRVVGRQLSLFLDSVDVIIIMVIMMMIRFIIRAVMLRLRSICSCCSGWSKIGRTFQRRFFGNGYDRIMTLVRIPLNDLLQLGGGILD